MKADRLLFWILLLLTLCAIGALTVWAFEFHNGNSPTQILPKPNSSAPRIYEKVSDPINSKEINFTNEWKSDPIESGALFFVVEFGSLKNDPKQGVVIVREQNAHNGKLVSINKILSPSKHGAIRVTVFNAFNLSIKANDGYKWIFNPFDQFREIPQ